MHKIFEKICFTTRLQFATFNP